MRSIFTCFPILVLAMFSASSVGAGSFNIVASEVPAVGDDDDDTAGGDDDTTPPGDDPTPGEDPSAGGCSCIATSIPAGRDAPSCLFLFAGFFLVRRQLTQPSRGTDRDDVDMI